MLAAIQLKSYYVSDISFTYTPESESIENKRVGFTHEINFNPNDEVEVILSCSIEDQSGLNLDVVLHGLFEVTIPNEDTEKLGYKVKDLCEQNTLSILFPYLRSAISDISLKANVDPIILPTINIVALINEQKKRTENDIMSLD
ncbi:protein-export chaperone SecB [Paenibacillus sp. FSL W7-1332]|uniref:protein-export chaperone SecB n=1 Tax=Paenibacillus sp. FSL W7-1332 TaxID=2921702 RepID=UPI0030CBDACE